MRGLISFDRSILVGDDLKWGVVTGYQRIAKLIDVASMGGHVFLISIESNSIARWIRLRFHTGLNILVRPRDIVVEGCVIKDAELLESLGDIWIYG